MAGVRYCPVCLTTFRGDPERCPNLGCGAARDAEEGWGDLLEEGDLLDRHYRVLRVLAVGGAGLTYLAREVDAEGREVPPDLAIKVLYTARSSGSFLRRLATEAQILQDLDHDHIVRCLGFVRRAGTEPYLVTRFEPGGSLAAFVVERGRLGADVAAGVLRQILLALDVAHQRGVVHRDLKPDNVLLAQAVPATSVPHIRVADFGIAKVAGGPSGRLTRAGAFVGTPEYAAPEQFEDRPPSPATDVFAAGAVLVFLLTGRPPFAFSRRTDLETTYQELLDALPPRLEPSLTPGLLDQERAIFQDIVDHTMVADQEERWTVQQVLARLTPLVAAVGSGSGGSTLDLTNDRPPEREVGPAAFTAEARSPASAARPAMGVPAAPLPTPAGGPPVRSASPRSRVAALAAGLGLSSGMALLGGAGLAVVALVLGAAGWWTGLGRAPLVRLEPLRIDVDQVLELRDARRLLGGDEQDRRVRVDVQDQLQARGPELARACGFSGPLVFEVLLRRDGRVHRARIDDGYPGRESCLAERLERLELRNPAGAAVVVRAGIYVP